MPDSAGANLRCHGRLITAPTPTEYLPSKAVGAQALCVTACGSATSPKGRGRSPAKGRAHPTNYARRMDVFYGSFNETTSI